MKPPQITVVGSANTDLVVGAPTIPRPGETVLGTSFSIVQGGKGANQAVAAARLGARVAFVGRIGADAFGAQAIEALKHEGIVTDHVVRDEAAATGVALIVVDASGENAIAVAPGANHRLGPSDIDRARSVILDADVVLLQLEIPLHTVRHAARLAADSGVPVVLNPAPAQYLEASLLECVTVLTPNRGEARLLAGTAVDGDESVRHIANHLRALGACDVIVTLGSHGALVATERRTEHVSGLRVEAVDTTAAGDAFNGALAYGIGGGRALLDAARFATLAGALTVTRHGAQPSLPTRQDLDAFARGTSLPWSIEPFPE